jgi:hypothetical protein
VVERAGRGRQFRRGAVADGGPGKKEEKLDGLGGERMPPNPDTSEAFMKHSKQFGELGEDWRRCREITGEVEVN